MTIVLFVREKCSDDLEHPARTEYFINWPELFISYGSDVKVTAGSAPFPTVPGVFALAMITPILRRCTFDLFTTQVDMDSPKPQGLFAAAYELLDSGDLNKGRIEHAPSLHYVSSVPP